jgi:hypothetical protein
MDVVCEKLFPHSLSTDATLVKSYTLLNLRFPCAKIIWTMCQPICQNRQNGDLRKMELVTKYYL